MVKNNLTDNENHAQHNQPILRKTVFPLPEGRRLFCGFYLLGQNSQSFRLRFRSCMKEAEYSAYNTRTIVQDEFDPTHIPYIVPMYVRAGAIIPTVEIEQYVGEKNEKGMPNTITLNIYPGEQGEYTMYLDDGVSRPSQPELFKRKPLNRRKRIHGISIRQKESAM